MNDGSSEHLTGLLHTSNLDQWELVRQQNLKTLEKSSLYHTLMIGHECNQREREELGVA